MTKTIDISHKKFSEGWTGVQVIYNPTSAIGLMEVKCWDEVCRFRIDFGKLAAIDYCPIDSDDLKEFIFKEVAPSLERS